MEIVLKYFYIKNKTEIKTEIKTHIIRVDMYIYLIIFIYR